MSEKVVISMKGIEKRYGKHRVLEDVNLEIHKGDIYGLVGKNGAGKTTIFKILLGLSKYQKGELEICGEKKKLKEARRHIGFFVGHNFFSYMTGRENLKYYCQVKKIKNSKEEVERVLKIVGLDKVKSHYKNYSMGMRQRLGIANAMLGNPEILVLDEPTNGLDPQGIADVRHLVQKLNEEYGMTVIISSHILGELQHTAHRFGIVNDGRVVKEITQDDLKVDDQKTGLVVDDIEKAKQVLTENGIAILEEISQSASLEDYYFNLVGGDKND